MGEMCGNYLMESCDTSKGMREECNPNQTAGRFATGEHIERYVNSLKAVGTVEEMLEGEREMEERKTLCAPYDI